MEKTVNNKPHLILMVGIPGSGKSYFAQQFTESFKAILISDNKIKNILKNSNQQTTDEISEYLLTETLKTGQTIVFDCNCEQRTRREELAKLARKNDYLPMIVWIQTDKSNAKRRFMQMKNENFEDRLKHFSPPHPSERAIAISGQRDYANQLKIILKNLASPISEEQ